MVVLLIKTGSCSFRRLDKSPQLPPEEHQRRWDKQHEWGSEKVHHMVARMNGYYVKSAQILASKTEFVPPQWCRRLAALWDDMTPRPWAQVGY